MEDEIVTIQNLRFSYPSGREVLDVERLSVVRGERVFLHGPSGSGKTTLLGVLAGVLGFSQGSVRMLGRELSGMKGGERDAFRGSHIGYVFQMFNLIPYLSVLENIALPCRFSRERLGRLGDVSPEDAALRLAEHLEIAEHITVPVTDLSVGQQQRVAAARALIGQPELIIADEPTSSLDADRREAFLKLLFENCRESGATLVFVSHDGSLKELFDRTISLPEINRAGGSA